MPRLKNSRKAKKRQKAKPKLVVAMVSKTSLRSKNKRALEAEHEAEAQTENEASGRRPKRQKPAKRFVEEETPKKEDNRKKVAGKKTKRKKKPTKTTQPKAAKRKARNVEVSASKRQKVQQEVEEMGAEFDELGEYEDMKVEEDAEVLVITAKSKQSVKHSPASKGKKKASRHAAKEQASHLLIENVPESHHQESDDDEEGQDEDDDDIDDSLFFGIPTEKSPEIGTCTHCKMRFHREELAEHAASCPERYVQCRECSKVLSNLQTLERHHKRFHLKLREVPCTLCDKMFIDEAASRKHLKTVHFKVKNFHCPHCDKSFSQRNKLTYHVRTHSGEKPFSCPECGRAFSLLWNLKTHLRTHTGEKPYSCDVCGRKFTQKQNMTSHMTTHKKPKLARSSSYVAFSSADNMDYFQLSELRQSGKPTMVSGGDGSTRYHQGRMAQAGHYLIDQIGNITPTTSGATGSHSVSVSQNSDTENGLGLLSSVARKGDNAQDYSGGNVEVDGIVDETHLANQIPNNPAIDQVVEVLVQPQGGHGDTTISLTTADVGTIEHEAYISTSRVDGTIETSDVFQAREGAVVTASASSLQQQQQAMNAQNVIPIGNANLSGLANILQNPEVLAAINAAAASNKFIVIGPVGMLSNSNAATTNTVSVSSAFSNSDSTSETSGQHEVNVSLCSSEAVASVSAGHIAAAGDGSSTAVMQVSGVSQMESGIIPPCDVEMIAADTSQDVSVGISSLASEETGNEVQSSVSCALGTVIQNRGNDVTGAGAEGLMVNHEESQVQSSQDAALYTAVSQHQNLEGEVSSSAGTIHSDDNTEADASVSDIDNGTVQSTNVLSVQSSNDNVVSHASIASSDNVFYTVHHGSNEVLVSAAQQSGDVIDNSEMNQQFIVTMKEPFVSSSGCTTSMASGSFITSSDMAGGGQSMVMVTADGQSYFTAVNLPDALSRDGSGQQLVLTPANSTALNIDGTITMSSMPIVAGEDSNNVFSAQLPEGSAANSMEPVQSGNQTDSSGLELGDFAVTDSTSRVYANSSNIDESALSYTAVTESESSIEVSGSNNLQPDSGQPKLGSSVSMADSQENQADSIIESSQVFLLTSASSGSEVPQSSFDNDANIIPAPSNIGNDSVVSGTENFVSSDLQESDRLEMQKTGVTSSNLMDNNAESSTFSGNVPQDDNCESDMDDSQVSTSLQI
ncbi:uncharacterized protein LOC135688463 [Rhopilema esculentum]|uniref:uncharacterized protein LOC135688463 n=1 Tax=Rhopilema esculentum TaxID=499914 RepID=UPI0031DEFB48